VSPDRTASALPVMTVSPYGTDMMSSLSALPDRSQSHFDADPLEAMTGCVELINTGRSRSGDELPPGGDFQAMADRYAFHGARANAADLPRIQSYRGRLDQVVTAFETGDMEAAIGELNTLLSEAGASPQIVTHDGRGPHLHVSRPTSPLADRMTAHFA